MSFKKYKNGSYIDNRYTQNTSNQIPVNLIGKSPSNDVPNTLIEQLEINTDFPIWRFEHLELNGEFCLSLCEKDLLHTLLQSLKSLETMTWQSILQATHDKSKSKNHPVDIKSLTKNGQNAYLRKFPRKEQQPSEIFSLAITNKIRVIGIRKGCFFNIIWIDPNHNFVATKFSS